MAIGISIDEFWNMTPHVLQIYINGHAKQMERRRDYDNYIAHLNGAYVRDALASTVGNMFRKKGSKPFEYPSEPYDFSKPRELTEDEKEAQRIAFLESLKAMQRSFEENKKANGQQS